MGLAFHVIDCCLVIGIKGIVTINDGTPVPDLTIVIDELMGVKTTKHGEYFKLLKEGSYTLKVNVINSINAINIVQ